MKSNYASGPYRHLPAAHRLTAWEMMLEALEISEHQAHLLFDTREPKAHKLKIWIMQHYRRYYVPLRFLSREQQESLIWD